jgi:hypothetical protein
MPDQTQCSTATGAAVRQQDRSGSVASNHATYICVAKLLKIYRTKKGACQHFGTKTGNVSAAQDSMTSNARMPLLALCPWRAIPA